MAHFPAAADMVFGYGSLVSRESASRTLGRSLTVDALVPAELTGWRRRFSQARRNEDCEKTFARADDGTIPEWVLGMNVEEAQGQAEAHNGVVIELKAGELERLDRRELRYDRVDVTAAVTLQGGRERRPRARIWTYVAKPEQFRPAPPPGAVILRSYAETIESAFAALGPGQLERYRETTLPYPAELIDGVLIRDEIPDGNPRDW